LPLPSFASPHPSPPFLCLIHYHHLSLPTNIHPPTTLPLTINNFPVISLSLPSQTKRRNKQIENVINLVQLSCQLGLTSIISGRPCSYAAMPVRRVNQDSFAREWRLMLDCASVCCLPTALAALRNSFRLKSSVRWLVYGTARPIDGQATIKVISRCQRSKSAAELHLDIQPLAHLP